MTLGDGILFAVVAIMAGNYLVMRLPGFERRLWLFWLFQGLNLGLIIFLLVEGIPGLEGPIRVFNYIFALLMMLRIVQNNSRFTRVQAELRDAEKAAAGDKEQALKAALERGRAAEASEAQSPES